MSDNEREVVVFAATVPRVDEQFWKARRNFGGCLDVQIYSEYKHTKQNLLLNKKLTSSPQYACEMS